MVSASAVVAPVSAQSHAAGHLRVVDAPKFSALPHEVLFNQSLSRDAVVLYAILQSHWWQGGECWASHAVLATEMRCGLRSLRTYLDELIAAGVITETASGNRRAKVYAPTSNTSKLADCKPSNRQKTTIQSAKNDTSNTSKLADSYKKTQKKKTQEEDIPPIGGSAAVAADQPAIEEAKPKKSRATTCPETFPLEAKHIEYAAGLGLTEAQARSETSKFLAHHRFKGTRGVDWYAGWQNWMRRSVEYGATTRTNEPAAPKPKTNGAKGWNVQRY